jgi:hypothetical protein
MIKDSSSVNDSRDSLLIPECADGTMAAFFPAAQKSLDKWISSFEGFSMDSFKLVNKSSFEQEEYDVNYMKSFFELYKPALVFSPDSSMFIDLYSYGITLEKKGKKLLLLATWISRLHCITFRQTNGNESYPLGLRPVWKKLYGFHQQNL